MKKNIIALKRLTVVVSDDGMDNRNFVSMLQANLMKLGYILTEEAFKSVSYADLSWIKNYHEEVIGYLSGLLGNDANYQPLYKNFPQDIIKRDDFIIFMDQIMHYWSGGVWEPKPSTITKGFKFEYTKFKEIAFAEEGEFKKIFTNLVGLNQAVTPSDQETINWFVAEYGNDNIMPDVIPFKETLCRLASLQLPVPVKTPTDVLRIAAYMSYESTDISLPKRWVKENAWDRTWIKNPLLDQMKFRKFRQYEREYLLDLLETTGANKHEMAVYKNRWIRLGEKLKPGKYKDTYPKVFKSFDYLRNAKHTRTWYSFVEQAFGENLEAGLIKLSERPGEYLRRLDALLRNNSGQEELVLRYLQKCGIKASNKVIFSILEHFESRTAEDTNRSVLHPKALRRIQLPTLKPISEELNLSLLDAVKKMLTEKFSKLANLPDSWIDPELKNVAMPKSMKSMEESVTVVTRGTRVKIDTPDAKVIRSYVHWDGGNGMTDHDLSVIFYGSKDIKILSYSTRGLKLHENNNIYAIHSGDVRNRAGACAEYVDVDIEKALLAGHTHFMMTVHDYTGKGFQKIKTSCGFMEREHLKSNINWLPETVTNAVQLTAKEATIRVLLFDLKTREYIMIQEPSQGFPMSVKGDNSVNSILHYLEPPKFSVYDLLSMHVNARGKHVTEDQAEVHYKYEDFVSNYEKLAPWMGI